MRGEAAEREISPTILRLVRPEWCMSVTPRVARVSSQRPHERLKAWVACHALVLRIHRASRSWPLTERRTHGSGAQSQLFGRCQYRRGSGQARGEGVPSFPGYRDRLAGGALLRPAAGKRARILAAFRMGGARGHERSRGQADLGAILLRPEGRGQAQRRGQGLGSVPGPPARQYARPTAFPADFLAKL